MRRHRVMAIKLGVAYSVIGVGVPKAAEGQRIGNQIKAAFVFARSDFVNTRWLRECGFVDSTRGVTGRSDIARWDLQRGPARDEPGRTRAMQWGLPRLKAE